MSMKKTDLEKNKAIKLREGVQKAPVPTRFGVASTAVPDRREQRRLDQAAGLVPFACKLKDELVQRLRALAEQEGGDLNALTERLIRAGLSAEGVRVPTAKKAAPPRQRQEGRGEVADGESTCKSARKGSGETGSGDRGAGQTCEEGRFQADDHGGGPTRSGEEGRRHQDGSQASTGQEGARQEGRDADGCGCQQGPCQESGCQKGHPCQNQEGLISAGGSPTLMWPDLDR